MTKQKAEIYRKSRMGSSVLVAYGQGGGGGTSLLRTMTKKDGEGDLRRDHSITSMTTRTSTRRRYDYDYM